jgi:hypothetical protein
MLMQRHDGRFPIRICHQIGRFVGDGIPAVDECIRSLIALTLQPESVELAVRCSKQSS